MKAGQKNIITRKHIEQVLSRHGLSSFSADPAGESI